MNNIFKVIWNHATQAWTAVGELASAKGKSKSVKLAVISTALLVVAGGAQAADVLHKAEGNGSLSISTVDKATDPIRAHAYANNGIAIGNGAMSGKEDARGYFHIAIGFNADASNNSASSATAIGANSIATGQGSTAIGNASHSTGMNSVTLGNSSVGDSAGAVAVGGMSSAWFHGSALGEQARARGIRSTALGNRAKSTGDSAISIGFNSTVESNFAIGIGRETSVKGNESVAVGNKSTISSANVSTLGANITVAAGRDGGVVLGHSSDAGKDKTKVVAVNNATVGTLTYSDFKGNLSKPTTELQGRFVSVGKEGDERQIKHVAAGQITKDSTDAINGSQLYSVANTLGTAAKGLADTLGVTLGSDGTVSSFSQPLNIAKGSSYNNKDKDGKTITAPNVTTALTNLNNYVNEGWKVTTSGNGYDDKVSVGHTVNFVGSGIVDVDGSTTEDGVRTVNISVDSPLDYASTTVDGKPVAKASDGKWYQVDENGDIKGDPIDASKIDKKGAKLTDSDTENNPYEKGNSYTYDDKGNITETGYDKTKPESKDKITAGEHGVQLSNVGWATQPDQAVNKDQLDQTVNKSGFFIKNNGKDVATKDSADKDISPKDKVTPNDVINFANGDGTVVNVKTVRDENGVDTTTVSVDVDATKMIEKNKGEIKKADVSNPDATGAGKVAVNGTPAPKANGSMETQKEADDREGNKLATVGNVVDAINSAKWFAKVENTDTAITDRTQNDTTGKKAAAIGAGETLTLKADKNLAVKRDGANVTYGLASEIEVDKITVKSKTPGEATTTFENGKVTNLKDHLTTPEKVAADKAAVPNAEEVKTPELTDDKKKEAATVNDVLNAGWNLKANGKQVAAVTNGKGVDFESDGSITITPTVENGIAKMKFAVNTDASIDKNKGSIKEADVSNPGAKDAGKVAVNGTPAQKADGSMETQDEANAREGNKLATVENVVKAINSAATFVKVADSQEVITASTANDNGVAVKSGDTVTHTAGKNLKVKRDGQSVTYALAQDIDVDSVKAKNGVTIGSGDNATTITSDDKGLNLAGKNGAATNINNVKDADLNSTSKQAVNGSQLYATNEKVANLGTTVNNLSKVINHHAGAIDSLDRKVNKHSKQARAGIAGANAAAALPQAYTQGKAMVAAAAGTFKGQNALAVGYSRISDNGKVILKLQGNANTSGDVGAGVGVGYQW